MTGVDGMAEQVTVVVRTAGERTVDACVALARRQAPGLEVVVVEEVPFARAVEVAFGLGVDRGRPWTLCLDADVLLRPQALSQLLADAEQRPPEVFCVEGEVADLLLAKWRPAGNHLYRTALLPLALERASFDAEAIRPERGVKDQLAELGHPLVWSQVRVGLHGHEQYLHDVFRTALVIANKFPAEVEEWAGAHWRARAAHDDDLRVASWAAALADLRAGGLRIDRRAFPDDISALLGLAGMQERGPLPAGSIDGEQVAGRLAAFTEAPGALAWRRFQATWWRGRSGPLRAMLGRHGAVGLLGEALRRAGDRLTR